MTKRNMEQQGPVRDVKILRWMAVGLSAVILLLVVVLAFIISEQARSFDLPTGEISANEGDEAGISEPSGEISTPEPSPGTPGTETVTVPVLHGGETMGESGTDTEVNMAGETVPEPVTEVSSETDAETEPDTGRSGVLESEMSVSLGLTFTDGPDDGCTVTGLGTCRDACLIIPPVSPEGRIVRAIGARAFAGSDIPVTVFIPATVTDIGTEAFSGCSRLAFITAEAGENAYRTVEGVLYSGDLARLVCYPPARDTGTLLLPDTLERIEDGALRGAVGLREIRYAGTAEDFSRLYIGSGNNILSVVGVVFIPDRLPDGLPVGRVDHDSA